MVGKQGFGCNDSSACPANDNIDLRSHTREPSEGLNEFRTTDRRSRRRKASRVTAANDNLADGARSSMYLVSDVRWPSRSIKGEADLIRRLLGNKFWEIIRSEEK